MNDLLHLITRGFLQGFLVGCGVCALLWLMQRAGRR
jgi:hypothetical protein